MRSVASMRGDVDPARAHCRDRRRARAADGRVRRSRRAAGARAAAARDEGGGGAARAGRPPRPPRLAPVAAAGTTRAEGARRTAPSGAGAPHPDDGAGTKHRHAAARHRCRAERGWPLDRVGVRLDYACIAGDGRSSSRRRHPLAARLRRALHAVLGASARACPSSRSCTRSRAGTASAADPKLEAFTLSTCSACCATCRAPSCTAARSTAPAPLRLDFNAARLDAERRRALLRGRHAPIRARTRDTLLDALDAPTRPRSRRPPRPPRRPAATTRSPRPPRSTRRAARAPRSSRRRARRPAARRRSCSRRARRRRCGDRRGHTALIRRALRPARRRRDVSCCERGRAATTSRRSTRWTPLVMCARKGHAETAAESPDAARACHLPYGGKSPLDNDAREGAGAVADALRARRAARALPLVGDACSGTRSTAPPPSAGGDDGANDRGFPLTSREPKLLCPQLGVCPKPGLGRNHLGAIIESTPAIRCSARGARLDPRRVPVFRGCFQYDASYPQRRQVQFKGPPGPARH